MKKNLKLFKIKNNNKFQMNNKMKKLQKKLNILKIGQYLWPKKFKKNFKGVKMCKNFFLIFLQLCLRDNIKISKNKIEPIELIEKI